ncbi:MAG TPA: response regulator [Gallionella sp.]|nr:response regulator [Gallionella sp.]
MNERRDSTVSQGTETPQTPILIVEDSMIQAELLRRVLAHEGYRVTVARDGAEGLAAARKERPRLVISDINMPVMDGYELCHAIRIDDELKDTPVILLTMLSDAKDVIHGLNAGADFYLTKPFNERHLLLRVREALTEPRHEEEKVEMELTVGAERFRINAGSRQMMNLLISTYENAILQNRELMAVQDQLKSLNDHLEAESQELAKANAKLKELDRLKSMFIASMSHELRTPLNSIIGFTGIILQGMAGEVNEEQRKQLTLVKESAAHLLQLINDVIDVSKIEANKAEVIMGEFDLADLVREVANSFAGAVQKKGVELAVEAPERLPFTSDHRRVRQILVNLLGNAVKFTDSGRIGIRLNSVAEGMEVTVQDTGIGIGREDMAKLFNAFSQIVIEGRPKEGSGLGLYLSQKMADLLGGHIAVESEPGKGSVFTLSLPARFPGTSA